MFHQNMFPFSFTVGFINISYVAPNLFVTEFRGLNKLVFKIIHIDDIFQVQRKMLYYLHVYTIQLK